MLIHILFTILFTTQLNSQPKNTGEEIKMFEKIPLATCDHEGQADYKEPIIRVPLKLPCLKYQNTTILINFSEQPNQIEKLYMIDPKDKTKFYKWNVNPVMQDLCFLNNNNKLVFNKLIRLPLVLDNNELMVIGSNFFIASFETPLMLLQNPKIDLEIRNLLLQSSTFQNYFADLFSNIQFTDGTKHSVHIEKLITQGALSGLLLAEDGQQKIAIKNKIFIS